MASSFKEMTTFFIETGAADLPHSDKCYLSHAIRVCADLKAWGCDEELCRSAMFHSIYGTEVFQGFTLPLERRGEVRDLICERAERSAYWNCAITRVSVDAAQLKLQAPITTPPTMLCRNDTVRL